MSRYRHKVTKRVVEVKLSMTNPLTKQEAYLFVDEEAPVQALMLPKEEFHIAFEEIQVDE